MSRARVWHWQAASAAIGAFCCVAAGPCASDPGAQVCPGGITATNGICGGGPGASIIAAVASPPPLVPPRFGGGSGFINGRGDLYGPNSGNPSSFSGGKLEQFKAMAVYPAGAIYPASPAHPQNLLYLGGAVVLVGQATNPSGHVVGLIARYTSTGLLDTTLNGTGSLLAPDSGYAGGNPTYINAVAIDSRGRIIIAGAGYDTDSPNGAGNLGNQRTFVARYNPDGSLDTTFGPTDPSGKVNTGEDGLNSLYPLQSGVIVGPQYGWVDSTGPAGWGANGIYDGFTSIAINPLDDSVYLAGYGGNHWSWGNYFTPLLVHYKADGTLDSSFAPSNAGNFRGSLNMWVPALFNGDTMADTIVGGNFSQPVYTDSLNAIAVRVAPSLTAANPVVTITAVGYSESSTTNGVYAGHANRYALAVQFVQNYMSMPSGYVINGTGHLDTGFHGTGYWLVDANSYPKGFAGTSGPYDGFNSLAIDGANGTIYAGGYGMDSWQNFRALVARIASNGTLTGSPAYSLFPASAFWGSYPPYADDRFNGLLLYPSSNPTAIIAGGVSMYSQLGSTNYYSDIVARLNAGTLALDTTFHATGSNYTGYPGVAFSYGDGPYGYNGFGGAGNDFANAIAFTTDGQYDVLGCGFTTDSHAQQTSVFRFATQPRPYPAPTPTATIQAGYLD